MGLHVIEQSIDTTTAEGPGLSKTESLQLGSGVPEVARPKPLLDDSPVSGQGLGRRDQVHLLRPPRRTAPSGVVFEQPVMSGSPLHRDQPRATE